MGGECHLRASGTDGGLKGLADGRCIAMDLMVSSLSSCFLFSFCFSSPALECGDPLFPCSLILSFCLVVSPSPFLSLVHLRCGYSSQVMLFSISCIQVYLVYLVIKCIWSNRHSTCLFTCYYLQLYLFFWVLYLL